MVCSPVRFAWLAPLLVPLSCGGLMIASDSADAADPNADCPIASLVDPGATCALPTGVSCDSSATLRSCEGPSAVGPCRCMSGVWACAIPALPGCLDAAPSDGGASSSSPEAAAPPTACPPADTLYAGTPCSAPGQQCGGDPTACFGTTFYEPLECQPDSTVGLWRWVSLVTTSCAQAPVADADVMAGDATPSDAGCTLLGPWHTHSATWNGLSTDATITFNADGTLAGQPAFTGTYSYSGSTLEVLTTQGQDMNCGFADTWTVTYSADCLTVPLLPVGSGCTGARRYLDWNVTLTRN